MRWQRILIILQGETKLKPVDPELLAAQRRLDRLEKKNGIIHDFEEVDKEDREPR